PFVIALARMQDAEWIVLSEENNGKKHSPKIPDVCHAEGPALCTACRADHRRERDVLMPNIFLAGV
ncbi:MAG TPA: hypothetical protein VGL96_02210, partial [Casimicrobiaceae bacterium]